MVDPITPAIAVVWRGMTYEIQPTTGMIAGASRRLKINLISNGDDGLHAYPAISQRAILLFSLLHRKFPELTLEECEDALFEEGKQEHYIEVIGAYMETLDGVIFTIKKADPQGDAPPLELKPSGGDSGQSE